MKKTLLFGIILMSSLSYGQSWNNITPSAYQNQLFAIWGFKNDVLICKTNSKWNSLYSTNNGISWTPIDTLGLTNPSVTAQVSQFFHTTSNTVLAVVTDAMTPTSNRLFRTTNYGANWTEIGGLPAVNIIQTIMEDENGDIYVFSTDILKSIDDGVTFTIHNSYPTFPGGTSSNSVVEDSNGHFYALTSTGIVYKSYDKGLNWVQRFDNLTPQGGQITINPTNDYLYVCGANWKVAYSTDTASTWTAIDPGYSGSTPDKIKANHLGDVIVADYADNIFLTDDNGGTWVTDTAGLKIGFSPISISRMAVTSDGCFYTINTGNLFKQCNGPASVSTQSSTIYVYPNPSNGWMNIASENPISAIRIYSVSGSLIETFTVNQVNLFQLDLSHYDAGMYWLSIESNQTLFTKSIIIN